MRIDHAELSKYLGGFSMLQSGIRYRPIYDINSLAYFLLNHRVE